MSTERYEYEICEQCNQPIPGQVVRTADDYPLCVPCAKGLGEETMSKEQKVAYVPLSAEDIKQIRDSITGEPWEYECADERNGIAKILVGAGRWREFEHHSPENAAFITDAPKFIDRLLEIIEEHKTHAAALAQVWEAIEQLPTLPNTEGYESVRMQDVMALRARASQPEPTS